MQIVGRWAIWYGIGAVVLVRSCPDRSLKLVVAVVVVAVAVEAMVVVSYHFVFLLSIFHHYGYYDESSDDNCFGH